jgi:hypothetical protein
MGDSGGGDNNEEKLNKAAATVGVVAVVTSVAAYAPAWGNFFAEVKGMHDAMAAADPGASSLSEFWAALNFWTFFAAMHPVLTPVLWISEVLHACPGPRIGGLVPVSFVALNALVIWLLSNSKALGTLLNAGLLAGLLGTVGGGLASQGNDMGGYNLALNGETPSVVRGCPTYDQVMCGAEIMG